MKTSFILFVLAALTTLDLPAESRLPEPTTTKVTTWLRSPADRFGCFLEGRIGVRDAKFNCNLKNYSGSASPCAEEGAYEEGPRFPEEKMGLVNSAIKHLDLAWEHGELQAIHLELDKKYSKAEIEKMLKLPKTGHYPSNLVSIEILDCTNQVTCVELQGFDHMGAADLECKIPVKTKN